MADYERVSICVVTHDTRNEDLFDRRIEIKDGANCAIMISACGMHPRSFRPIAWIRR
jgi:hypothetical protein